MSLNASISKALLHWFKESQRNLPWRENYDPYQVWISEIMLQQTQVKTVLPYFSRWIKVFPSISAVAKAPEDKVLKLWEGLGYYSRARNIQKTARILVEKNQGNMFKNYDDILKLPGIGKYTAAAIASIAFNQDYPVVDGNVIRVMARLKNFPGDTSKPESLKKIGAWAHELLPKGQARYFNQAMMELGALICVPGNAKCSACPVQKYCKAYQHGTVIELPNRGKKMKLEKVKAALVVLKKGNKVFIQKRPAKGLLGGLWEFPGGKVDAGETILQALHREIDEELGIKIKNPKPLMVIHHGYTRFKVELHCFEGEVHSGKMQLKFATHGKWVEVKKLRDYPFPVADLKLIETLMS